MSSGLVRRCFVMSVSATCASIPIWPGLVCVESPDCCSRRRWSLSLLLFATVWRLDRPLFVWLAWPMMRCCICVCLILLVWSMVWLQVLVGENCVLLIREILFENFFCRKVVWFRWIGRFCCRLLVLKIGLVFVRFFFCPFWLCFAGIYSKGISIRVCFSDAENQ